MTTTTSDVAIPQDSTKISGKPLKRDKDKKNKEKDMEQENYKLYKDGPYIVFEFMNEKDFIMFREGYKKENLRYWRQNPVTSAMLSEYQKYRNNGFVVKYKDEVTSPMKRYVVDEYETGFSRT